MNNQKVSLFGLLKTKIKRVKAQQAALNLCRGWSFTINLVKHPAGRIWIVWKPGVYDVNITNITEQLIHYMVDHRGTGNKFNVTVVYGFNNQSMRRQLWEDIKSIHLQNRGPWAIMGDFNCILSTEERMGIRVTIAEIKDFKKCMEECSMQDMRSSRAFYTWSNQQPGGAE